MAATVRIDDTIIIFYVQLEAVVLFTVETIYSSSVLLTFD